MKWRKLLALLTAFGLIKALWIAAFYIPGEELLSTKALKDLLSRRAYLFDRVVLQFDHPDQHHKSLPDLFQGEWALGTLSMTSIGLTNIAFLHEQTRESALNAVGVLIERMRSPVMSRFDTAQWHEEALSTLDKNRGHIAYLGQLNLTLAAWHYLGGDDRYRLLFDRVSDSIARRIEASPFLNAETYPGEIYPMDNVAALASLELHDRFVFRRSSKTVRRWVDYAQKHLLDPRTGLVVHSLDSQGQPTQGARGCSSAWYSFFFPVLDADLAKDQYNRMLLAMQDQFIGISGIREYPKGVSASGDVDSGPVIFGLGTSATGFAIGGARWQKDIPLLGRLAFTSELIGFTFQWNGQRRYLTAPLVGEAIMLAMRTMTPWDLRFKEKK